MATTSFAQHGLVRIAYELSGEGETVFVMLHGLLSDRVALRPLADALADDASVIMIDLRGHGGSSAIHGVDLHLDDLVGDVVAVLDSAGIQVPVQMIGIEMGAVIADRVRMIAPERVASVLRLNDPSPLLADRDTLLAIADRAYKGQTGPAVDHWLALSWGVDWQSTVPKPRIAAARRSAPALPQMLNALAYAEVEPTPSLLIPGGTPFADDADLERVLTEIRKPVAPATESTS
ncbi:MAG: alpha/beta fold hydrolase [Thermomicrobiales bacterium]|nr:alpha/beta fold hydrolase [Thermomicrobiales bacterium]